MVRFKLKTFLLSLIGIVAIATSSAFAYFIFSDEVKSSQLIEDKIRVDNIEENYVFGRDDYQGKDYTIYLFPSTLYLDIYQAYLDGTSTVLPEKAFGYIEAVTESDGSISYTPKTDSKTGYSEYETYYETYEDYVNANEDYLHMDPNGDSDGYRDGVRLTDHTIAAKDGRAYGYEIVYDIKTGRNLSDGRSNIFDQVYGGENRRIGFGATTGDNAVVPEKNSSYWTDEYLTQWDYSSWASHDRILDANYLNFNTEQYNYRIPYKNDRFGYWSELNYNEGRILPQKIEVFESISQSDFAKETMTPWTSMGDENGWYDLNFAMRTYIDLTYTGNKITSYSLPFEVSENQKIELEAFKTKDVINYFDINKSLSGYADKDGIIRLFPSFSNSKGYVKNYNGGRDALRMDITESSVSSRYPMLYFKTTTDNGENIAGVDNTNIAFIPNVDINNNVTNLKIAMHPASGPGEWSSKYGWTELYENEGTTIINYIKNQYGLGLYNFYFVVGQCTGEKDQTNGSNIYFTSENNVANDITDSTVFAQLKNKQMNKISDSSSCRTLNYHFHQEETLWGDTIDYYVHRTYVLLVEKIAEASFYRDLSTSYIDENELKSVAEGQVSAPKFYNLNAKLYKASLNASGAYDVDSNSELTANNSYIYLAQNVDLTESNENLVMQIRFNNEYYNADMGLYNLNPLSDGEALIFNPTVDNSGNFTFNDDAVFTNASEWFTTSSITFTSSGETQNALTLTNFENNQGIYDILIEYNKANEQFNVYTYRHTNIFIKLFENKVNIDENTGLAIHKNADGTDFNYLLWRKQYYLGVNMKASDTCDISFNSTQITFQGAVESFINSNSNTDGYTKQNLLIRDFVTDALIGYFDSNENLVLNLRVMKNYILYFDKIGS